MKQITRLIFVSCHILTIQSLITLEEANQSHFDYLRAKNDKLRPEIGDDLIQMPSTQKDVKLAKMDPELYRIVKDPVQKKFTFTLDEAILKTNEIDNEKSRV